MRSITRRDFIRQAAAGIAAATAGRPAWAGTGEAPPNVLYVFADQMRFCAMGCAGNAYVRTPNLDRLAGQGMLLENAFSCTPICSPYRAQLLTGRYGHATGIVTNDIKLPESEVTLAEALRERGYATGYIGKWHLEGGRRAPAGDPRSKGFVPKGAARQGFDYWAALECGHNYYRTHYFRDDETPIPVEGYEPDVQTDLAVEFLRQSRGRPFLLMLSYGPPHNPYKPPEAFDRYDPAKVPLRPNVPEEHQEAARKTIAQYYGLVTSLDHCVGRLMGALEELGLARNTILCFTSDHGDMLYSHGQRLKQRPWEESMHVPFLLRFPERIAAGQRKETLFASVDVMPTLLGLCEAPAPKGVHGKDLSRVFLGESKEEPDSVFLYNVSSGGAGGFVYPWRAVRTGEWLYAWSSDPALPNGDWLLYHVKKDPYELRNCVGDPECREVKERLRARLERWRRETGENLDLEGAGRRIKRPDDAPADPNAVREIDFTFDRPDARWKPDADAASAEVRDGALVVDAKGSRPAVLCAPCDIIGTRAPKVRVRLSATAGDRVTLSWTAVGLPRFSEPKSITLPLQADGKPHDYVFTVGENPRWQGKRITALRLEIASDAGRPAGVRVEVIQGARDE